MFERVLAREVGRPFSINRTDTRKNVRETFVGTANALSMPKDRESNLRREPERQTWMAGASTIDVLAAIQVLQVEEIT